jgi:hypothetical protein
VVDPGLAGRDLRVVVVVDEHVDEIRQLQQLVVGGVDLVHIRGVQVEDALLHEAEADGLAVVVENGDLAAVLGVPRHRPRVRHRVGVLVDEVLPPGDAGRVDRVGNRVLPAQVVEGVEEVRPGLVDVRDVGVVERPEELALHERPEHVDRREEDVEGELAGLDLGDGLAHRVERRDLGLALVLLAEAVDAGLVDVGDPVVDLEGGACLRRQAALDGLVVVEDRPANRVVLARQRDRDVGVPRALAAAEQTAHAGEGGTARSHSHEVATRHAG